MRHETFTLPDTDPGTAPLSTGTAEARRAMNEIVASLDARFSPAGQTLAQLVETIGTVLEGMEILESVLGGKAGQDSPAADALIQAARNLREAPRRQADRSAQVQQLGAAMTRLGGLSGEIAQILTVLQFYTVNLKIAAAGADEFVEFANDMSTKMASGGKEVEAFNRQIGVMLANLADMRAVDDVLARECARVIPQVPDRLEHEVESLRVQQAGLARLSANARAIILRLQGNVGQALGAMQIGDITRQRLEHVRDGCAALDGVLDAPGTVDGQGTCGHMLRLLGDQLDDLTTDFRTQTGQLLASLHALAPDCQQLLDQGRRDESVHDGAAMLRELGDCISGAHAMTSQLHNANAKAVEIAEVVLQVVAALRQRVQAIEALRFEVDYMAINVNIRARRDAVIGRPVAVIADEIRICSVRLDELIRGISAIADELGQHSIAFETSLDKGQTPGGEHTLEEAQAMVERAVHDSDAAMADLDQRALGIATMIEHASEELSVCDALSAKLRAMADSLGSLAIGLPPVQESAQPHPVFDLMAQLARSYTMSSERAVHNRYLLPGMVSLAAASAAPAATFEDDDALFDDALF